MANTASTQNELFRLRSYQAEMVEESLKTNIIVAMDTGSGKTHIALARTAAELETCPPNKLVWFLTPTVALCEQQFDVFKSNLPGYGIQVLSGKDDVDHWSDQSTWDAVLDNIRIVLSTHQVLLDALTHGFVGMSKLALIVFDEAHHCTQKHPANLILANFYLPVALNAIDMQLPRILGLSASPVMKAKAGEQALRCIEENMNATAKTPKIHRSELLQFVHRPQLHQIVYKPIMPTPSRLLASLQTEFINYDFNVDPYVVALRAQQSRGYDTSKELHKAFISGNTYCFQQLKTLLAKSKTMAEELGTSVADWYIQQCLLQFQRTIQPSDQHLLDWAQEERQHLSNILQRLPVPTNHQLLISLQDISPKVETLVDILVTEAGSNFTGLVFIEQRVWVAALMEILSIHPKIKNTFNVGTFVGTSQSSKRKASIANFVEPLNQQDTLDRFRAGQINLILATSVLEEGIDISSCHLVICFERPKNLKSFVQRRGRARRQESKYFIFLPESGDVQSPGSWELLEDEMKKAYLNDLRQVKEAEERELMREDGERFYQVPSTGALLTLGNASQHLHHFCSLLNSGTYVDPRPQFNFKEAEGGRIIAEVTLPLSVDPAFRTARSLESWETERMAAKDASFEAYRALHVAGLVNDNLLPPRQEADDQASEFHIKDNTPSIVNVSPALDPWVSVIGRQQQNSHVYYRTLLKLDGASEEPYYMILLTPAMIPEIRDLTLYWSETKQFSIKSSSLPSTTLTEEEVFTMREITQKILISAFQSRMQDRAHDFIWLLVPSDTSNAIWDHRKLQEWNNFVHGTQSALDLIQQGHHEISQWGVLSTIGSRPKYIPRAIILDHEPCLHVTQLPKRRDFLHQIPEHNQGNEAYSRIQEFSASECIVNNLPAPYTIFALAVPSVINKFEAYMIADTLRSTLLAPVLFESQHVSLILQALTSSSTGEEVNYQRLEFLGDCILKFIASVHLMADNLTWPESFLTGKKSKIVSNGFAARAAMSAGLDKFILTKRFTGAKWSPRYTSDVLTPQSPKEERQVSSKLLADVVESLIGASYVVGGFTKAFVCIQTLLPLEKWTSIPEAGVTLFEAAPADVDINNLSIVEALLGYTFKKKMLLLEALTHASYNGPLANCSYERLEFLGDAVLDYIISERLYAHVPALSHQRMHTVRTAMANAAFLTFRMFETAVPEEQTRPSTLTKEKHYRCLWQFLRSGNPQLTISRETASREHAEAKEQITRALEHDQRFPWHLLSLTDPPKFLSDIVESVIGAIYIDSHGDIPSCEIFVRRLGILDCLERILRDEVDCLHPKERLGHLAIDRGVQYIKITEGDEDNNGTDKQMYRTQVQVGGEMVGGVEEGLKRLNAETLAAWNAVRILEQVGEVEVRTDDSGDEWFDADEGGGIMLK